MSESLLELVRAEIRGDTSYQVPHPPGIRIKLDANELPDTLPYELRAELAAELAGIDLNRYPDPACTELRELIADGHGVAPEQLIFGNGSDEIIHFLAAALAEPRPGRQRAVVLYPTPTFSVYRAAAQAAGVDSVEVPLTGDFTLDLAPTRRALTEHRPNWAIFARPNNPTGTLWPGADLVALARENGDVLLVSDEAYADYSGDTLLGALGDRPNLAVMRTLSKIGMAGVRLGYLIASAELVAQLDKVRPPYNISSLCQRAAHWLLSRHGAWFRERCQEVSRERDRVMAALSGHELVRVFPSRANLILFRVGTAGGGGGARLWQALVDAGILVREFGDAGPLADCLRVTVGSREENDAFLAAVGANLG